MKFTEGLFTENIPILRKKRDTYDPRDLSWFDDENADDALADPLSESWGANNGARIVGGTQAAAHSWPWAVLLTVCIEYGWARECFKCGAVLISRKWALTAGHCLPKNRKLSIVADIGNHDSSIENQGVKVVVEDYMVHEGFKKLVSDGVAVIEHDVGLIKLAREVDYDDKIRSACLPNEHVCIKPGTICVVVGWGYTDELGVDGFPNQLQQAPVKIFNNTFCKKFQNYNVVTDHMLCAGWINGGIDACGGDSGGPLSCKIGDEPDSPWVLAGTVSWGIGCARARSPGVYTNIAKYSRWIKEKTGVDPVVTPEENSKNSCIKTSAVAKDYKECL